LTPKSPVLSLYIQTPIPTCFLCPFFICCIAKIASPTPAPPFLPVLIVNLMAN